MKNHLLFLFVLGLFIVFSTSCERKGCTDQNASNYDYEATKDNGTCSYSQATFYAKYGFYSGVPITRIEVSINGKSIGSITSIYPNGPGNCSATGTVAYTFESGQSVDWNSTVYLSNGATLFGSGTTSPSRVSDCIKINVTN